MNTFARIYGIAKKIPKGRVMTYGQIADITHVDPRIVGYALHANKNPKEIPCHRIVHKNGALAGGYVFGGKTVQKKLLKSEGVQFIEDKVDMKKSLYL